MWTIENHFKVVIGGNTYIDVPNIVVYKGQTLFTLKRHENGELGIYFELYDGKGSHVASVKRNQIYMTAGQTESYAREGSADEYILRENASGQIVCQINRKPSNPLELEVSARLYTPDGFLFEATPTSTNVGGIVMRGNTISGCPTGISIGAAGIALG
jgi:hypothetical protein